MNKKLLALYGLKWNPFSPEVPTESLYATPRTQHFCWRIEQNLIQEGGFALVTGDPGTGKSVVLRLLAERLGQLRDISVGAIAHPSSNLADFYREMGIYLVSNSSPTIAGAASRPCGNAGRPTWRGHCCARCC